MADTLISVELATRINLARFRQTMEEVVRTAGQYKLPLNFHNLNPKTVNGILREARAAQNVSGALGARGINFGASYQQLKQIDNNLRSATTISQEFGRQLAITSKRFGAFLISSRAIYAITGAFSQLTQEAIQYDRELSKIAQLTNRTVGNVGSIDRAISKASTSYGANALELAGVAHTLAEAGRSIGDIQSILNAVAPATLLPSFDNLSKNIQNLEAVLRQFSLAGTDSAKILDLLNTASKSYSVSVDELFLGLQRAGTSFAFFSDAKLGGEDNFKALREFTALFTSVISSSREAAEVVGTFFRGVVPRLGRPTIQRQLSNFGINLRDDEGNNLKPFEAVGRIATVFNRLDPRSPEARKILETVGQGRDSGRVAGLLTQFPRAQEALAKRSEGSVLTDAEAVDKVLLVQFQKIRAEFSLIIRDFIASGTATAILKGLISGLKEFAAVLQSLKTVLPGLITGFAAIGLANLALGAVPKFIQNIRPVLRAQGGSIPTLLTPGEKVFAPDAVNKIGAVNLQKINNNNGIVPGVGNSDSFFAALNPGSFVLRKAATEKFLKRARGGGINLGSISGGRLVSADFANLVDTDLTKFSADFKRSIYQMSQSFRQAGGASGEFVRLIRSTLTGLRDTSHEGNTLASLQSKLAQDLQARTGVKPTIPTPFVGRSGLPTAGSNLIDIGPRRGPPESNFSAEYIARAARIRETQLGINSAGVSRLGLGVVGSNVQPGSSGFVSSAELALTARAPLFVPPNVTRVRQPIDADLDRLVDNRAVARSTRAQDLRNVIGEIERSSPSIATPRGAQAASLDNILDSFRQPPISGSSPVDFNAQARQNRANFRARLAANDSNFLRSIGFGAPNAQGVQAPPSGGNLSGAPSFQGFTATNRPPEPLLPPTRGQRLLALSQSQGLSRATFGVGLGATLAGGLIAQQGAVNRNPFQQAVGSGLAAGGGTALALSAINPVLGALAGLGVGIYSFIATLKQAKQDLANTRLDEAVQKLFKINNFANSKLEIDNAITESLKVLDVKGVTGKDDVAKQLQEKLSPVTDQINAQLAELATKGFAKQKTPEEIFAEATKANPRAIEEIGITNPNARSFGTERHDFVVKDNIFNEVIKFVGKDKINTPEGVKIANQYEAFLRAIDVQKQANDAEKALANSLFDAADYLEDFTKIVDTVVGNLSRAGATIENFQGKISQGFDRVGGTFNARSPQLTNNFKNLVGLPVQQVAKSINDLGTRFNLQKTPNFNKISELSRLDSLFKNEFRAKLFAQPNAEVKDVFSNETKTGGLFSGFSDDLINTIEERLTASLQSSKDENITVRNAVAQGKLEGILGNAGGGNFEKATGVLDELTTLLQKQIDNETANRNEVNKARLGISQNRISNFQLGDQNSDLIRNLFSGTSLRSGARLDLAGDRQFRDVRELTGDKFITQPEDIVKEIERLKVKNPEDPQINRLMEALKLLSEDTRKLTAIQEELAQVEKDRSDARSIIDLATSNDFSDRFRLQQGISQAQTILSGGFVPQFAANQTRDIQKLLGEATPEFLQSALGPRFKNITGPDITNAFLNNTGRQFGGALQPFIGAAKVGQQNGREVNLIEQAKAAGKQQQDAATAITGLASKELDAQIKLIQTSSIEFTALIKKQFEQIQFGVGQAADASAVSLKGAAADLMASATAIPKEIAIKVAPIQIVLPQAGVLAGIQPALQALVAAEIAKAIGQQNNPGVAGK